MNKFNWFSEEFHPAESEHVDYQCVYRATKSTDVLRNEDFLPWIIEHPRKVELFKPVINRGVFGVSLFTDLESLKEKVKKIPDLNRKTKSFSKGFTSLMRGISPKENSEHHVEYYLYDYVNNNPCDDFEIIEVR